MTSTAANGVVATLTSTTSGTPSATAALISDSSSNSSGVSSSTGKIIGGVIGGIGGAALLTGLAIVAWRIWGRKKNDVDDDDFNVGTGYDPLNGEKDAAGRPVGAGSQFQSTLEQHHAPPRNVNASANF